jgi:hypothetical protein
MKDFGVALIHLGTLAAITVITLLAQTALAVGIAISLTVFLFLVRVKSEDGP